MWFYAYYFFLGQNDETSKFNSEKKLPHAILIKKQNLILNFQLTFPFPWELTTTAHCPHTELEWV